MPSEHQNDLLLAKLTFETQRFHGLQDNDLATQSKIRGSDDGNTFTNLFWGSRTSVKTGAKMVQSTFRENGFRRRFHNTKELAFYFDRLD